MYCKLSGLRLAALTGNYLEVNEFLKNLNLTNSKFIFDGSLRHKQTCSIFDVSKNTFSNVSCTEGNYAFICDETEKKSEAIDFSVNENYDWNLVKPLRNDSEILIHLFLNLWLY
jgi:hypothetical protein